MFSSLYVLKLSLSHFQHFLVSLNPIPLSIGLRAVKASEHLPVQFQKWLYLYLALRNLLKVLFHILKCMELSIQHLVNQATLVEVSKLSQNPKSHTNPLQ